MKRRFLSACTVLAMLLTLLPTAALAVEGETGTHTHCVCGKAVCSEPGHTNVDDWQPLDLSNSSIWLGGYQTQQSGSYYLTEDLDLRQSESHTALTFYGENAASAITVNICLNGHSILAPSSDSNSGLTGAIYLTQYATVNICNCGSGGKISNGVGIGSFENPDTCTLNLYDVKIQDNTTGGSTRLSNGNLNMYGGSISAESSSYGIRQTGGTFHLYGGAIDAIEPIYIEDGKTILDGSTLTSTAFYCVHLSQKVNYDGDEWIPVAPTVKNGLSLEGNVTFVGTDTAKYRYPIYVDRTLNAEQADSAVLVDGYTGDNLTIGLGTYARNSGYVISGTGADTSFDAVFYTTTSSPEPEDLEIAEGTGYIKVNAKGGDTPVPVAHADHPVCGASCTCGGSHETLTGWKKLTWDATNSTLLVADDALDKKINGSYSSTATCYTLSAGNYYLGEDITLNSGIYVPQYTTVTLCLNGHTLYANGYRNEVTGTLNITDCQTAGEIAGISNANRSILYVNKGTLNLYQGKLCDNVSNNSDGGGAVEVNGSSDGTSGAFHMYGGTISGNQAYRGGGVSTHNKGMFNMYGGAITENTVTGDYGGGVYMGGTTFEMSGGSITKNKTATAGGGVYICSGVTATVSGTANITGNTGTDGTTASNLCIHKNANKITVGALTAGAGFGVSVYSDLTEGNSVTITSTNGGTYASQFSVDAPDKYELKNESGELKLYRKAAATAEAPTINTQPTDQSISVGGTAALNVGSSVADGGTLSYQWYSNTTNSAVGGTPIADATGASYTPPTTAAGTTYYYCVITNTKDGQSATATTNVAVVTVTDSQPTTYTVTYDADGGTGAPTDLNRYAAGAEFKIPDGIPTKEGVVFHGWRDNDHSSNLNWPGDTPRIDQPGKNKTFTAVWGEKNCSITNGGTTTYYASLADALRFAVTGDTIVLERDYTDEDSAMLDDGSAKSLILDLNGKNVINTVFAVGTGSLKITDTSAEGNGALEGLLQLLNGELTIEKGTIGALQMTDGTLELGECKFIGLYMLGNGTSYGIIVVAKGGEESDLAAAKALVTGALPEGKKLDNDDPSHVTDAGSHLVAWPGPVSVVSDSAPPPPVPVPPTITTTTLPGGTVGEAYSQTLAATGDTLITWSVTVGTLPAGLTLNAETGVISGTPTTAGTTSFTVTATNGDEADTQVLSITVDAAAVTPPPTDGGTTSPTYPPVIESTEHGTAEVSPQRPSKGRIVIITTRPDAGYAVNKVTVSDSNGKTVEVTCKPDGTYTFVQPGSKVTITVTFKCDGGESCPSAAFRDLDTGLWYHDATDYVLSHDIMDGYGGDVFGPYDTLTRAMMVQFLYNSEGRPAATGGMEFDDVTDGDWYADAVAWASASGFVEGYGGRFGPDMLLTREQMITLMYRWAGCPEVSGSALEFEDAAEVSNWAVDAMRWAVENDLVHGVGGTLAPKGEADRVEAAQLIYNLQN